MKIEVEFINHKGFWRLYIAKSKMHVRNIMAALKQGTTITWTKKNHCVISQQYIKT